MNYNRFYLVDTTDPANFQQAEVARSKPNELMPTVEYDIPIEYEVHKIKVVVGYGNTDTYLFATKLVPEAADVSG